jgi:hypothetical protein
MVGKVVIRAILHNLGKGLEIKARDAAKSGENINPYAPNFLSEVAPGYLQSAGYSDDLIGEIAKSGQESGHNSLPRFLQTKKSGSSFNVGVKDLSEWDDEGIIEAIVHLADDITHSSTPNKDSNLAETRITTIEKRMVGFDKKYP